MKKEFEDQIYPKALLDINPEQRKSWAMLVDSVHDDWDAFLKQDLDAVIIGTPPATHAAFAIKCLKAGIDVWSEVPMGLTMDELWAIIDAEKGNKGTRGHYTYGENYCYMLQPQFMAMRNAEGAIGNIYYSEGEYTHSVEHYMIEENFLWNKELDPEKHPETKPTWRADFQPIKYGHALGPCLYVLNRNKSNVIERPVEVTGMGNMKMQKRFNTDNFQIATVKTDQDTIIKFVIGFVLGSHGRIFYSYWGSRGLFMGGSYQAKDHYYYAVPEEKADFPYRHQDQAQTLTDDDLLKLGTPHGIGGHGGGDDLMFTRWIQSLQGLQPRDIDVFRGAEMTAPGILAVDAMKQKKTIEIPRFDK
jgi:predicted dehydrogenase